MPLKSPLVALIGRTNVGKSTLFNRLLEKQKAITSPLPGTTRDRNKGVCLWQGRKFTLIDSGGLDADRKEVMEKSVRRQAEIAVQEADLILFVVDGQQGVLKQDREIARRIKKTARPKFLVVNKIDNLKLRNQLEADFFRLGLGKPIMVSATNGSGTGDLLEEVVKKLPEHTSKTEEPEARIAIVGKTNVGKSSFVNALLGEDRIIVSAKPHTTRDPQDIEIRYQKKRIVLIDTAGLRRKKTQKGEKEVKFIEKESAQKSLLALKTADVALLMLDATDQITFQDKHIAQEIIKAHCGIVVVLNKWDLIKNKNEKTLKQYLLYTHSHFPFLLWAPYVFISAAKKIRLKNTLDFALKMKENRERAIDLEKLKRFQDAFNSFLKNKSRTFLRGIRPRRKNDFQTHSSSQSRWRGTRYSGKVLDKGRKKPRLPLIKSLKQTKTGPPQFSVILDSKNTLPQALVNTLKNALRAEFNLWGTPIIIKQKLPRR